MILLALLPLVAPAQGEGGVDVQMSMDIVSQYLWRGQRQGDVSLQPTLAMEWKGLSLEVCGSKGLSDLADNNEIDLTLGYSFGGLEVGLTDYWTDEGGVRYFDFKYPGTGHTLEAFASYDAGFLSVAWYTNVAGADGTNLDGDRAWSSYAEVAVPFDWAACHWQAAVGIVPYATTYYDVDKFALSNVSLSASRIFTPAKQLELPLTLQVVANPDSGNMYFIAKLSLVWNN